ncbi:hypothetical protein [Actinoplanes sp. NPDC023714]|uniref:hypothetical protein n=1 Tax=Actinoplanes sp. NPDC023714 TaxID=3154322 RepID=UPI0033C59297
MLPHAATRVPDDLLLLEAGRLIPDQLHPLISAAVPAPDPGWKPRPPGEHPPPADTHPTGHSRLVDCDGARHRIGLVNGVLAPLDHDPDELRREQLLVALGGTPMPCLQAIDATIRHPEDLPDVRARLDHGDYAGALDTLEALLGPEVLLREGDLQDELRAAADQRIANGLFRSGMTGHCPPRSPHESQRRRQLRTRPRQAHAS